MLTLEARFPCSPCGYRLRMVMTATATVNKRSLRLEPFIGAGPGPCPECQSRTTPPLTLVYQLTPKSAEQVRAVRLRRWPALTEEATTR